MVRMVRTVGCGEGGEGGEGGGHGEGGERSDGSPLAPHLLLTLTQTLILYPEPRVPVACSESVMSVVVVLIRAVHTSGPTGGERTNAPCPTHISVWSRLDAPRRPWT